MSWPPAALLLLALASASVVKIPRGRTPLQQNLLTIIKLLPMETMSGIVAGYVESQDPEIVQLSKFMKSEKLSQRLLQILKIPEVQAQLHELDTKGVHIIETYILARDAIARRIPRKPKVVKPESKGLKGLYDQIWASLPLNDIITAAIPMVMANSELQIIMEQLGSAKVSRTVIEVFRRSEIVNDLKELREAGVDVDGFQNLFSGSGGAFRIKMNVIESL